MEKAKKFRKRRTKKRGVKRGYIDVSKNRIELLIPFVFLWSGGLNMLIEVSRDTRKIIVTDDFNC